jgi:hypothetical protein
MKPRPGPPPLREVSDFSPDANSVYSNGHDTHAGLQAALRKHLKDKEFDLDKIGFARSVLEAIENAQVNVDSIKTIKANFAVLLVELAKRQRKANREASGERIQSRVNRACQRFLVQHQEEARKEDVTLLIEEIEGQLDASPEGEEVRAAMRKLVWDFKLEEDPRSKVPDYEQFLRGLEGLPYAGARAVQSALAK